MEAGFVENVEQNTTAKKTDIKREQCPMRVARGILLMKLIQELIPEAQEFVECAKLSTNETGERKPPKLYRTLSNE